MDCRLPDGLVVALAIGDFLYGRTPTALLLTAVFVASGSVLIYVINRLWDKDGAVAS